MHFPLYYETCVWCDLKKSTLNNIIVIIIIITKKESECKEVENLNDKFIIWDGRVHDRFWPD